MAVNTELDEKIRRLAAVQTPSPEGIVLRAFGGRNLLAALLVEVDDTVVGRTLHVTNDAGGALLFDVANRLLLNVRRRDAAVPSSAPAKLISVPENPQNPEFLAALRDLLDGFIGQSQTLVLGTGKAPESQPSETIGISAANLAKAWDLDLRPKGAPSLPEVLDSVLFDHRDDIVTWVRFDDGQTNCGGSPDHFSELEALAKQLTLELAGLEKTAPGAPTDRCVATYDIAARPGLTVLYGGYGGNAVALLVQNSRLAPLALRLQEVLHGWD